MGIDDLTERIIAAGIAVHRELGPGSDAYRVRIEAEAAADAEAIRIRKIAEATAESIQKVNQANQAGGESYFRYRQIEMLPRLAPPIADALANAKLITISGGEWGAAETATNNITNVIQTVLAAQLVARGGILEPVPNTNGPPVEAILPASKVKR